MLGGAHKRSLKSSRFRSSWPPGTASEPRRFDIASKYYQFIYL